jgi:hypothetical protein
MAMRTVDELKRDAKRIIKALRNAGWSFDWIRENARLHVTSEEAAELMEYAAGRMTLMGDSSPANVTLQLFGLKLTSTDINYFAG